MRPLAILALLTLVSATPSLAQDPVPLTPIPAIGVIPESLDFGCVEIMNCRNVTVTLFNDGAPGSILGITGLHVAGEGFSLVNPPSTPFTIPPNVALTLEFCPQASGQATGTLTIESNNAPNSPVAVNLTGFGNLAPLCDAGGPYSGEVSQTIQFDGTASSDPDGAILTYAWDFGDGGQGNGPLPTHRYETAGLFTVTLAVVDYCGSRTECETTADVSPPFRPVIGVDPPGLYYGVCNPVGECFDQTIELFNDVPDPLIILTVTDLAVTGDGFSLLSPPTLPLEIPGGGTITLTLRFCPTVPGWHEGALTITAPGAVNSPVDVPLAGGGPAAGGGVNPQATLPLHAHLASTAPCTGYLPVNCVSVRPTVNVPPDTDIVVFLLVYNHNVVAGVQTAFEWDPSWQLHGSYWDCQPGQITEVIPEHPGGPIAGRISTAFDCVLTTNLTVVGRMFMRTGSVGCLAQVRPDHSCGIHVLDCDHRLNLIDPSGPDVGRVCVTGGGIDACGIQVSVEPSTWGAIKHSFH